MTKGVSKSHQYLAKFIEELEEQIKCKRKCLDDASGIARQVYQFDLDELIDVCSFLMSVMNIRDERILLSCCENNMKFRKYKGGLVIYSRVVILSVLAVLCVASLICGILGVKMNIAPVRFIATMIASSVILCVFVEAFCSSLLESFKGSVFDLKMEGVLGEVNASVGKEEKLLKLKGVLKNNYISKCNRVIAVDVFLLLFTISLVTASIFLPIYFKLESINKGCFYSLAVLSGIILPICMSLLIGLRDDIFRKQEGSFVVNLLEQRERGLNSGDDEVVSTNLDSYSVLRYPESWVNSPMGVLSSIMCDGNSVVSNRVLLGGV